MILEIYYYQLTRVRVPKRRAHRLQVCKYGVRPSSRERDELLLRWFIIEKLSEGFSYVACVCVCMRTETTEENRADREKSGVDRVERYLQ